MNITHRTDQAMERAALRSQHVRTKHTERVTDNTPSEADLGTMMALQAAKDRRARSRRDKESLLPPVPVMAGPSPAQRAALAVFEGRMISRDVADLMGCNISQASGYLSGLCEKGYIERVGFKGPSTIFRKTSRGHKLAARMKRDQ